MKKSIDINVSGGAAAFGSVSQGDHTTVHGSAELSQEEVDRSFTAAEAAINGLAQECGRSKAQIQDAIAQLSALRDEVKSGRKDTSKAGGILKTVAETCSWALPAIKEFAKTVWPAILGAIGL